MSPPLHSITKSNAHGRILHPYYEEISVSFGPNANVLQVYERWRHIYIFRLYSFPLEHLCSVLDNNKRKHMISQHFNTANFVLLCCTSLVKRVVIHVLLSSKFVFHFFLDCCLTLLRYMYIRVRWDIRDQDLNICALYMHNYCPIIMKLLKTPETKTNSQA